MNAEQSLRIHLESFGLPTDAIEWLLSIWRMTQFFDDVVDGDPVERSVFDLALLDAMVFHATNPFFVQYREPLALALATMVGKWQASDIFERSNAADARSYMWRAGYYDLILSVIALAKGAIAASHAAPLVLSTYGESFEDYQKEFSNG